MADTTQPRPFMTLLRVLLALALLVGLGAGAIALERPAGMATGKVLSERGRPLADARVVVSGPVTRTLYTLADGTYAFHHLPVGDYYVSARAKGHDVQHQESAIKVAEGKVTGEVDFKLAATLPSLDVTNVQRVFTPKDTVRVTVRGNQLDRLEATLYKLDLAAAAARDAELANLKDLDEAALARLTSGGVIRKLRSWSLPVAAQNLEDEDWFHQPVQVDGAAPGAYVIMVGGKPGPGVDGERRATVADSWWFTVGKLALVTKRSGDGMLAWVTDLDAKRPQAGAEVRLFGKRGRLGRAVTDARGVARLPLPRGAGEVLALATLDGAPALTRAGYWADDTANQVYAFTERPVYRPGQQVKFKAIVRARDLGRFRPAAVRTVAVTVKDALGAEIMTQGYPLTDASAFDGTIDLPESGPLGEYRVEIKAGGDYEYLTFQVAEYRKPEYKVEVTPAKPRFVMGDTAEVGLLTSYYFGAPVPGAKLNVTVYEAPHYGSWREDEGFFAGYADDPGYESVWGFGDVVKQEEIVADAQGRARVQVPLARPTADQEGWRGDKIYTVAVEALDASGRPVKANGSFLATQADVKVSLEADQALYAGGTAIGVAVGTTDHDGKPVASTVDVRVLRLESETKTTAEGDEYTETKRIPVFTGSVRTDARGRGTLQIPSPGDGSFEIEGEVRDAQGRSARDIAWAWVAAGDEGGGTYRYGALQVLLDKKVYKPGDRAKALVVSPVAGATALLTVEGARLHDVYVVKLNGTSGLVEIPVREAFKPNAFISAAVVNGKEYMEAERSLNVLPEDKFLKVEVKTAKQRVEPGETVTYAVEARDWKGRPVDAEVALGVVDQAIYAIEPEHTPDIRGFFHGPRWNTISTAYSFAEDYSGGLDKFAPDPRVRARFEDTAAWFPSIRTGADGHADVSVTLPDNLTTWVATARAATLDSRVGSASHRLIAAKDLLVRLETPRFAVSGDRVVVSAIAHAYTDTPVTVDLALEAEGLDLTGVAPKRVTLQPGGSERVSWEVLVPAEGLTKARVFARPAARGVKGDAMELPIPALAYGVEDFTAFTAAAAPGAPGAASFEVPAATLPGAKLTARLYVTPLPAIATAIDYLHHYKYGCVEQTMSRFLPDAALQPRLAAAGVPTDKLFPDQRARMEDGVRRLLGFQHGDGGWGWWSNDESKAELTAYVLYGLAEARRADADVPADARKRAIGWLVRTLPTIGKHAYTRDTARRHAGADVRALALFALAEWEAAPAAELERLWRDREGLSPYGRAQFALALARSGDRRAAEVTRELRGLADETAVHAQWGGADEAFAWHDSTTEATAWALRALLATTPDDPLVPKAVRWLESKNARGYWEDTKDTAAAAIALADYLQTHKPPTPEGFAATLYVDDKAVGSYDPGAGDLLAAPPEMTALVGPGTHRLRIDVTGGPDQAVDVTGGVTFRRTAEGLPAASGHGLSVERAYLHLPADVYARAQGKGPGQFFNDETAKGLRALGSETRAGERVLVKVTLKNEQPVRWMCISDPLPAGCEILEDQPANWSYWWDHQEYRDEEAAFFFDDLSPGTRTLYYVMRPTTPGRYRVLPTVAWAMYQPEVRARGTGAALTIRE